MFNYEKVTKKLASDKTGKQKTTEILEDMIYSKDFAEFLFKPKGIPNLTEVVSQFYAAMSRPQVIKCLVNFITSEGYDEFNRTQATFFYSVASMALESNNERAEENSKKKKSGQISNKEFNETNDKIEEYNKYVKKLFKCAKKIVKKSAYNLSEDSRIPEKLCRTACYMVPETEDVDRYKIGRFLDSLLTEFYDQIDKNNYRIPDNANWKAFFKKLFGKDNLAEVATFLLLEGHNRRDAYDTNSAVIECWDSLTEFALEQMNAAPEQIRDQMLELYLKRISRMFSNGTYELRVDLLSLPKSDSKFPQLASSINKYADKLKAILEKE